MKTKVLLIISLCAIIAFMFSCSSMTPQEKRTATGAAIGGGSGAVLGGAAGGTKGAVVGGLGGAAVGGALGHYTYGQPGTAPVPGQPTPPPPPPQR